MSDLVLRLWRNKELTYEYEIVGEEDADSYAIWRDDGILRGKYVARNIPTIAEAVQALADAIKDEVR